MSEESANKRIAKNTIFLYFRSLLIMAISLFSSRIILQALGVHDYGLYGAVGSIVMMFSIINNTLAVGTSRFLTFELGKGDAEKLKKTFSAAFAMHVAIAFTLFILLETIGLWFLNNRMQIPEGREFAANVIFQLSIVSCMFSLTQVPYNALIIAHEKMNIYAYVGIAEAVFKLALIFALLYITFKDNLIAYGIILAVWSVGLQIFYRFYCYKRFPESHLGLCRDKSVYKNMLSYSLWDFIGSFCATGINHGLNILINSFFGVALNAARTIALQVEQAITVFSTNFITAMQPQIVKNYASGNKKQYYTLISYGGKYAFFLLFMITLPFFLESNFILSLWLVEVPPYTTLFLRVVMLVTLFRVLARPLIQGIHATGNVRFLNLSAGLIPAIFYLPSVYILFKTGFEFWSMFYIQVVSAVVSSILEIISLRKLFLFDVLKYLKNVYLHAFAIAGISSIVPVLIFYNMNESMIRLFVTFTTSILSSFIVIWFWGLSKEVRIKLTFAFKTKIKRLL